MICSERFNRDMLARSPLMGALAFLVLGSFPMSVEAQGVRGWVGTSVQVVELRPLGLDSIARSDVVTDPDGGFSHSGRPVVCLLETICTAYAARPEDQAIAATQDLSLTAWGFGVQGLSFTTLLRGRARFGSDLLWPRTDDEFDALLAYAQLSRGPLRVRAGRQEVRSGLGFAGFDGGSADLTVGSYRDLHFSAYGGRSMARGLREPTKEALRGIEDFVPDESVYLVGGSVRWRAGGTSVTTRYHREILADRSGLVSERASVDFSGGVPGARITGSLDYDFGFEKVGKGHLTVAMPLSGGAWLVEATARRYVPYFDLSTIWGFFEPVSYSEVVARVGWSGSGSFGSWVTGGWRTYEDANATEIIEPLTETGWRADAGLFWQPRAEWQLRGSYQLEWGPGAFLSSGDVTAAYRPAERLSLMVSGTTFQQIEEFRLGDGRAVGGGISFDLQINDRTTLGGGYSVLRHRDEGTAVGSPWNQSRAWSTLRVGVGRDPGLTAGRRP